MKREFVGLLVLLAVCSTVLAEEYKLEGGVVVLDKTNFDSAISENEYILVEFYAPWCVHCKSLAPEYSKAAEILKESNPEIKLAKVDAVMETDLAERYQVQSYPTLIFFRHGERIPYDEDRKAEDIVAWLVKRSGGPPVKKLATIEEFKAFKDEADVTIVAFVKDESSETAKVFSKVADTLYDFPFGLVEDDSLFAELKVEDGNIVLYKKFDEGEVPFKGEMNPEALKTFVSIQSLPLIVEFSHKTASKIFGGNMMTHLLLFLSKKEGHFEKYLEPLKPVAQEFREKILFVLMNTDESVNKQVTEHLGLKESEIPTMRLIRLEKDLTKYKCEKDDLSPETVKQFVQDYFDGKVKKHFLSQDLPEDWNKGPVTILVVENFDEIVFDQNKDVLVEFYAPWCTHCKQLEPIYEKLGEKFKSNDDVVVAKMDAVANELEHTTIGSYPTIKLYKKGDNKVIDYSGERTLEGLSQFLESGGEMSAGPPVQVEEDEDDDAPKKDEL